MTRAVRLLGPIAGGIIGAIVVIVALAAVSPAPIAASPLRDIPDNWIMYTWETIAEFSADWTAEIGSFTTSPDNGEDGGLAVRNPTNWDLDIRLPPSDLCSAPQQLHIDGYFYHVGPATYKRVRVDLLDPDTGSVITTPLYDEWIPVYGEVAYYDSPDVDLAPYEYLWPYTIKITAYQTWLSGYPTSAPLVDAVQIWTEECELCPPEERITHEFTFDYWAEDWHPMIYPGAAPCKSTPPTLDIRDSGDGYWKGNFCSPGLLQSAGQNTIFYSEPGIYTSVEITGTYTFLLDTPQEETVYLEAWVSYNGVDWELNSSKFVNLTVWPIDLEWPDETVSLDLEEMSGPGLLAIAMTSINSPFQIRSNIRGVELTGCFDTPYQPPGECGFQDYDMNSINGKPSLYWETIDDFNNPSIFRVYEGFLFHTAPAGIPNIHQTTSVEVAGDYNLDLGVDSRLNPQQCELKVLVGPVGGQLDMFTVECIPGITQTVTIPLYNLQRGQTDFYIGAPEGGIFLDYACLSPREGSSCLNVNPDFSDGLTGYETTGTLDQGEGGVILAPGGRLRAIGVDYSLAPEPYILEITGTEVLYGGSGDGADTVVNDGAIPASEAVETITETRMITALMLAADLAYDGPTVWNVEESTTGSRLLVSEYCIKQYDGEIVYFDPRQCDLLYNADFLEGTSYWNPQGVSAFNGFATFGSPGEIWQVANDDLISGTGTVLAIGRSSLGTPLGVTVTVSSDAGETVYPHSVAYGDVWQFEAPVSGTTSVSVTAAPGFELDYICIWDEPIPPISIPSRTANDECLMPPMVILTDTFDAWLPTVWPSVEAPENFEAMMAYNTLWVRYIGCFLKFELWGEGYPECAGTRWPWEYEQAPWLLGLDIIERFQEGDDVGDMVVDTLYPTDCGIRGHLDFIILQLYALFSMLTIDTLMNAISALTDILDAILATLGLIGDVVETVWDVVGLLIKLAAVVLTLIWAVWIFLFTLLNKILYTIYYPDLCPVVIDTDNYAILAGWNLVQTSIADTPLALLGLVAANILIYRFVLWAFKQFQ